MQSLLLSIIIPTLNEEKYISTILKDIIHNTLHPHCYEIIVADNGSEDKTIKHVQNIQHQYPHINLQIVSAIQKGVSKARNTGAKHAQGAILLFLDADVKITKEFLAKNIDEMQTKNIDVAACYAEPDSEKLRDKLILGIMNFFGIRLLQKTDTPIAVGAAIFIRRDLHTLIGGFNESMHMGEDFEYVTKASQRGIFAALESVPVIFSMRRFNEEGRWTVIAKTLKGFFYHLLHRNMKDLDISYEFGKHK